MDSDPGVLGVLSISEMLVLGRGILRRHSIRGMYSLVITGCAMLTRHVASHGPVKRGLGQSQRVGD